MKKILFTMTACVLCLGLMGSAFAYFSDTETSSGNTFTAGTLDLKVDVDPSGSVTDWQDSAPNYGMIYTGAEFEIINNMEPGDLEYNTLGIKNAGTVDGEVSIEFINVVNAENYDALTDEAEAYDATTNPSGDADTSDGTGVGELGASVLFTIVYDFDGTPTTMVTQQSLDALDATGKILLGDPRCFVRDQH